MLVEDNDIVRVALSRFFKREEDITVVAEASDAATAIKQLQADPTIDIVVADWNMPNMSGLELANHVTAQYPKIKTIILTMHGKQNYKDKAKAAGVHGFLLKDGEFDDLLAAVRDVAEGKLVYN